MIYLIEAPGKGIDKDGNEIRYSILKLGYCDENRLQQRLSAYKTYNPDHELICTIPNITRKQETALHSYLIDKRYKDTTEWYIYIVMN